MDFDHLVKAATKKMGGTKNYFLVAPRSIITNVAIEAPTSGASPGDLAKIAGPITFGAGDGFVKIYNTLNLGNFAAEIVGRRDTRAKKLTLTGVHPGSAAEALEFDLEAQHNDWVVLVPTNNGQHLLMGTDGLEAEYMGTFGTGTIENGENGIVMKWEAFSIGVFIYTGTVTLKS
jgi:hypothetical protein